MEQMTIFVIIVLLTMLQLSECVNSDCNEKQQVYVGRYGNYTWPRRDLSVSIEGDIVLGALHAVHGKSDSNTCGPIKEQGGIQALEMLLYTLDSINNNPHLLPGVSLGLHVKDDCDTDEYGLEQAKGLLRGSKTYITDPDSSCMDGSAMDVIVPAIPGVIGASSTVTSMRLANLLKLYKIPQISFFSTSTVLSDTERFPYFFRTIPADTSEIHALVELVKKFNWSLVSVLYEDSRYGIQGHDAIVRLFKYHNICMARSEILRQYPGVAGNNYYDDIARKLLTTKARGVIILASGSEVNNLLDAFQRNNITETFSWIWGDSSGGEGHDFHGNEAAFEGALTIHRQVREVSGFRDYFLRLTPPNNNRNPWFVEFWEQHFKCKFPGSSWTPYNEGYNRRCTGTEKIEPRDYKLDARLQYVSDTVMAFAFALHDMLRDVCGSSYRGLCDDMKPVDGDLLMGYLRKVSFNGLSGQRCWFLPNRDGPARFVISNFIQEQSGHYTWREVGHFESEAPLSLNLDTKQYPKSVCSEPCGPGETQVSSQDQCCWVCLEGTNNGGRIQTNLAISCLLGLSGRYG